MILFYIRLRPPIQLKYIPSVSKNMSIFVQKLNPITGANDWIVQQEDYDYHQEVARSSFADMLHDTERNQKYEMALKSAINIMHAKGKTANVLDIGTGTGLLSMMAATHGADSVIACEGFRPMSECALKVIERNGFKDKIKIIPKRSTDMIVGPHGDMENKCNILVTEVFDTELIGEGALLTFSHAHRHLLEKDCIVVPQSATIYAQVVECPLVQHWNKVKDIYDNDGALLIKVPDKVKDCPGSAAVHDLQLNQLGLDYVSTVISPIPVFRFDWSGTTPFVFERSTIHSVKAECTGQAQAVFMWWDLQMDTEGKVVLSCAPFWAHPQSKPNAASLPWRDHWMQAIYYLPREVKVQKGQELNLLSCHDEFSLWFNLKTNLRLEDADYLKPVCQCGLHVAFSRTRIGQINDSTRNKKYIDILQKHITQDTTILILSDGFYLSLAAAKLGASRIYFIETNYMSRKILLDFIKFNAIANVEVFENVESLRSRTDIKDIGMILGEPYFSSGILPWDNLLFVYLLKGLRYLLTPDVKIFPKSAIIKAVAVKFDNLQKIRLPLAECEGFSMVDFDNLIEISSNISDDNVEAQPLWEYPGIALSNVVEIISIDCLDIPDKAIEASGGFDMKQGLGGCNGIAIWMEWIHEEDGKNVISSGPLSVPEIGSYINWDKHTRQGVCLFSNKDVKYISYDFKFDFEEGNISFNCK